MDEKLKAIQLTDSGITKAETALGIDNIYTEKALNTCIIWKLRCARRRFLNATKITSCATDRLSLWTNSPAVFSAGRRWSEGLHQAIEAKESVKVQQESRTVASITFQNYFRMYKKLAGMTGTALTSQEEFYKVYGLDVVAVPTNMPTRRTD